MDARPRNTERLGPRPGTRGFVARLNADSATDIYLVRGNDTTGRPAWYYVRTHRGKKVAFEAASKRGNVQLTEYGVILLSGYGKTPPPEVVARMSDEYGFSEGTTSPAGSSD